MAFASCASVCAINGPFMLRGWEVGLYQIFHPPPTPSTEQPDLLDAGASLYRPCQSRWARTGAYGANKFGSGLLTPREGPEPFSSAKHISRRYIFNARLGRGGANERKAGAFSPEVV